MYTVDCMYTVQESEFCDASPSELCADGHRRAIVLGSQHPPEGAAPPQAVAVRRGFRQFHRFLAPHILGRVLKSRPSIYIMQENIV